VANPVRGEPCSHRIRSSLLLQPVKRLTLNSFIVAVFSGSSVLAGFAFDLLIAARFGLGKEADAYFAAVTLPVVVLTALLTASQSVLVVALAPLTPSPEPTGEGVVDDGVLFSSLLNLAGLFGLVIAIVGVASAHWLAWMLSPGFDAPSLTLAASLMRVLFLRAPAATMVEVLRPALLGRQRFALASAGYLIDSLTALLGLFFLLTKGIMSAGWALTLGAWAELGWLVIASFTTASFTTGSVLTHRFYRPRIVWRDAALRQVGCSLAAPLGGLIFRQGVILAERWFGSFLGPGSVAALGYANKIIKVFGGVVFDSVNTTALPSLTAAIHKFGLASASRSAVLREWKRLLSFSTLVAFPLGLGLALFSRPFVTFFFSGGTRDLGAVNLAQMATLLAIYSLALIPLGPFRAQQSYLYAAKHPASVGWLLFLATIVTLLLDWPLVQVSGMYGLGVSFALGVVVALIAGFFRIRSLSTGNCSGRLGERG